jgi:glycosyltransferase involved in cell wall biosynthesis
MQEMDPTIRYVVVTPVRDEEKYIEQTVKSMISQTIVPVEWIIVDDGSKDRTGSIIDGYAREFDWIRAVHRGDRGFRQAGGGVMDAFYEGYGKIRTSEWEFVVKLDGDLLFRNTYFQDCFREFNINPKLGIGGGTIYNNLGGRYEIEECPRFHVRGATKIYRRECWIAIGDLIRAPGWDTLDELKANMLGWETRSFREIPLYQERVTGGAEGQWKNSVKNGVANYVSAYHPLFMFLKCCRRLFKKPFLVDSAGLMYGYMRGYLNGMKQTEDENLVKYIRGQQIKKLVFMDSIWE